VESLKNQIIGIAPVTLTLYLAFILENLGVGKYHVGPVGGLPADSNEQAHPATMIEDHHAVHTI